MLDNQTLDSPARNGAPGSAVPLRVAFIHAPNPLYADTQNYGAQFMPVWAYTLAAHLPADGAFELSLYDTRFEQLDDVAHHDVFLLSGINQDIATLNDTLQHLRAVHPESRIVIGGPICWSFSTAGDLDRLDGFDHIVIGDGEAVIGALLDDIANQRPVAKVIRSENRFPMAQARPMHRELLAASIGRYYGAVVEVSRGCPFLCEFCDIRILPDNNRPHNKSPAVIVEELDYLSSLGVRQVLFACDNFIGDPRWAEDVVDAILAWQRRNGRQLSLYTWLTINLHKFPRLMEKMRRAGFDLLFIGIESFEQNSLLETAKVQNTAAELTDTVRTIQSYGFIVVAGLIFGFDSDSENACEKTLDGMLKAGLLSGDPSLLTALPGTPLYRRIEQSGRLRQVRYGLGGYKYQTNIKYLLPRATIIGGYRRFVRGYNDGAYQYARLANYLANLQRGNFIALESRGYGDLPRFLSMVLKNRAASLQLLQRMWRFGKHPGRVYYAFKGLGLALWQSRRYKGALGYAMFWLFAWSNAVLKYGAISDDDFDIESVDADFDLSQVLPSGYTKSADENIPAGKIRAQQRYTVRALEKIAGQSAAAAGPDDAD